MTITVEQLKAEHPDVAKALIAEGFEAGKAEGAAAERQRIQDVEAQHMPGHDELIDRLKFDGKTTGPEAAVAVLKAEREKKADVLDKLKKDAPAAVPGARAPEKEQSAEEKQKAADPAAISAKAKQYIAEMAQKGITVSAADAVAHVMKEADNG